ncbi:grasp-with-spasm system ATP-grasp peptide maturase [Chryseotalea sanaruensis]|uniref:Grasp-with-spasm system ATP-grasp peptide maturase n=1 Tax=Chryseotalea sanaruensis TaxID=2482724 RepID=A0A401U9H0_9BACT|nr:grasp-with-spasm system ATP-grasp peptide maturase [Chryseotalea sanaruensis]GCC51546.1 grasp-with-spasm system ATP-grasp peptide maturase [Chryseotalea sanaruensis]
MIAVISNESGEPSTSDVINWISYLGHDSLLLYGEDFGRHFNVNIAFLGKNELASFELHGKVYTPDDISIIWYRRDRTYFPESLNDISNDTNREKVKRLVFNEVNVLRSHFYALLKDKKWLSDPKKSLVNKLDVLKEAASVGLKIPETLVTTSKSSLIDFFQRHNKNVIIKPMSETLFYAINDRQYSLATHLLTDLEVESMPETFFPCLVQECVVNSFEIRVFYLEGKCYSIAVFHNQNIDQQFDNRIGYLDHHKSCYQLPKHIETSIDMLLKNLQMETGSLDFIRTPEGEFVFLEVNPVGQFSGMVSYPGNYYLEKKIAQYLIRKSNEEKSI